MAQYFKRQKQNGQHFYIDENGNVVSETTAKGKVSESRATGIRHHVADLSEGTQRRIQQNELRARLTRSRANLEEAFKRSGMTAA